MRKRWAIERERPGPSTDPVVRLLGLLLEVALDVRDELGPRPVRADDPRAVHATKDTDIPLCKQPGALLLTTDLPSATCPECLAVVGLAVTR